jgi:hypothetical protein
MGNKRFRSAVPVIALLCAVVAGPALAQGRGRGQAKPDKAPKAEKAAEKPKPAVAGHPEFGSRDRERISTYYSRRTDLPPGLAKRETGLPPGLEQHLRRNGTLPPGLQKRIQSLPPALERQLVPLPAGYRRGVVDSYVIVYKPGTYLVADVIANVVR